MLRILIVRKGLKMEHKKQCSICYEIKLLTEFQKNKTKRSGYNSECKNCNSKRGKNYYKKYKRIILERQKKWRVNNLEICKESKRKSWYKNYETDKKWRKNHRWLVFLGSIRQRCNNSNVKMYKYYGGKGIKCLLSKTDIKYLWDKFYAKDMIQASLHRINSNDHYRIGNCEFLEWQEHKKIHGLARKNKRK